MIYGFGKNDAGYDVASHSCPYFELWRDMIRRVYSPTMTQKLKGLGYSGCSVNTEWSAFSCFKIWMLNQKQHDAWLEERGIPLRQRHYNLQLDKDLIIKGNKEYGPDTCVLVPARINTLINPGKPRGGGLSGVNLQGNKYVVRFNKDGLLHYVGSYTSEIEAHEVWKKEKRQYVISKCEEYSTSAVADKRVIASIKRFAEDL